MKFLNVNLNSRFIIAVIIVLSIINISFVLHLPQNNRDLTKSSVDNISNMPLIDDDPFAIMAYGGTPIAKRTPEYRDWISQGLKILVTNASGSGTIVYYDNETQYAYVQSCGHLWNGNMTAQQGSSKKLTCSVQTWYHNDIKLPTSKKYDAEVLYYSNDSGKDVSLLRFKPDWIPAYFPLANDTYTYKRGELLNSIGCDLGSEVAHYDVEVVALRQGNWPDLVTTRNSPRPGRSGGGLLSDRMFVGVCWGTSVYSGEGNGYFTPLKTIRYFNEINGYAFINEASNNWANQIPIIDRNNPQKEYPRDYIPLPRN